MKNVDLQFLSRSFQVPQRLALPIFFGSFLFDGELFTCFSADSPYFPFSIISGGIVKIDWFFLLLSLIFSVPILLVYASVALYKRRGEESLPREWLRQKWPEIQERRVPFSWRDLPFSPTARVFGIYYVSRSRTKKPASRQIGRWFYSLIVFLATLLAWFLYITTLYLGGKILSWSFVLMPSFEYFLIDRKVALASVMFALGYFVFLFIFLLFRWLILNIVANTPPLGSIVVCEPTEMRIVLVWALFLLLLIEKLLVL